MNVQTALELNPLQVAGGSSSLVARLVSDVLCPPVVATLSILVVAAHVATATAWESAILFLALVVIVPTLYLLWLLHRGEVTDFHLRVREQRIKPMILVVTMTIGGWILLLVRQAPAMLVGVTTVGLAISILLFLITLRWKISGHTTAISGFVVLCLCLAGTSVAPLALSVPVVAWARVRLRCHTLAQTIVGAVLGLAVSFAFSVFH